ncbi:MAG TPA: class I SAM-dependent methyltransferase [Thermoanaerobaculia bacterium]|jgi:SAM-dependent methyltransferase|nr:class I SAM-dependent methyltransferase [Thermoanaerobaculia bacterium]
MANASAAGRQAWDQHWRSLDGSAVFGRLASWVRRAVLRPAVRHYTDRWLAAEGVLVEAGCGTGEASAVVRRGKRRLVGLDFSLPVLLSGRGLPPYHFRVAADLRALPFADGAVAGFWNLGVLEHFPPADGLAVLAELRRALRPGGRAVLFWPPSFGLSRCVLAPVEALRSVATRRRFRFFPDEVNRLGSRRQGRATLAAAGLQPLAADFTPRDSFIHLVLVGMKTA